jgi:hypothetical protein
MLLSQIKNIDLNYIENRLQQYFGKKYTYRLSLAEKSNDYIFRLSQNGTCQDYNLEELNNELSLKLRDNFIG